MSEGVLSNTNKHGLSRYIPEDVARAVRQRDGFGCVVCGLAIYDYEHFDPEFADATTHAEYGIVLLCVSCHGKKTRCMLSRETIGNSIKNPRCKQIGFSFESFDIGGETPEINIGSATFKDVQSLITIYGEDIFSIAPPLGKGLPFRVSAKLLDANGNSVLEIVENQWRASVDNWDVKVQGSRISIRQEIGNISLVIRSDPPRKLVVENLVMRHRGIGIAIEKDNTVVFETPGGGRFRTLSMSFVSCRYGLVFGKPPS